MSEAYEGNPDPGTDSGNPDPQGGQPEGGHDQGGVAVDNSNVGGSSEERFYDSFESDLKGHPAITKFESAESLAKGYIGLEKVLGQDKVIVPKDKNDSVGWMRFNEKMGVPTAADGYNLPEASLEDGRQFDRAAFGSVVHKHGLRPDQAEGLWQDYTNMIKDSNMSQTEAQQGKLNEVETQLRHKWGEAYESKLNTATKLVRTKIKDQQKFDRINALVSQHPDFLEFVATMGEEYSENSIGGFKADSFKMTPEEAQSAYDEIMANQKDPYWGNNKEATFVRKERVAYVESLIAMGANPNKIR